MRRERLVLVHLSRRFRRTKMRARVESMNKKKRRAAETIKNLKRGIYRLRRPGRRKRMSRLAKRNQFQECLRSIRQEATGLNRGRPKHLSRPQNKRESPMTRIPVGAVLAETIYDPSFGVLVEVGTEMTPGLLDRLHQLVLASGQEFKLWVADF